MAAPLKARPAEHEQRDRALCLEVLAASMMREVNQPLSALVASAESCLQMLSATSLNLEGARDNALRMLKDATRAAAVMQRMWSLFAKTESSNESVDLNQAAGEVLLLLSEKLQRAGVSVRRRLAANLPRVRGDSVQLQQAILHLVMNAAEAMSEIRERARELVVSTESVDGHVRLSVKDAGAGFTPRDAQRLFDPFYTTKAEGMGIGLFLSRWIIENHRGAISGELNDGPGATFSFSIPR